MAIEIKPIVHPNSVVGPCEDGTFTLTDKELFLFDLIAQEHTNIEGTEIDLYQMSRKRQVTDPLYDEVVLNAFDGPFRLKAWVEYPEVNVEIREEGFRKVLPSTLWVARIDIERVGARPPYYGDVAHFWKTPFFDQQSVSYDVGKTKRGYYFTLTDIYDDGHVFDQASFVGFKATLARNTEFTPERRLTNT